MKCVGQFVHNPKIDEINARIMILRNHFKNNYKYKNKITNALDRLDYQQKRAAEQFYEMFEEKETKAKAILER